MTLTGCCIVGSSGARTEPAARRAHARRHHHRHRRGHRDGRDRLGSTPRRTAAHAGRGRDDDSRHRGELLTGQPGSEFGRRRRAEQSGRWRCRAGRARRERASRRRGVDRDGRLAPAAGTRRGDDPFRRTTSGPSPAMSTAFVTRPPASATRPSSYRRTAGFSDACWAPTSSIRRCGPSRSTRAASSARATSATAVGCSCCRPAPHRLSSARGLRFSKASTIRGHAYSVVGVVSRPAGFGMAANELPEVYLPYTTAQSLLDITHLHAAAIAVRRAGDATRVARDITRLLRDRHRLGPDEPDDFIVRTQARDAVLGKGVNPMLARAIAGSVVNLDDVTLARDGRVARTIEPHDDGAPGERRERFAARRRDRHHERDARVGDRAHTGDRSEDGARCTRARCAGAVPGGGGRAQRVAARLPALRSAPRRRAASAACCSGRPRCRRQASWRRSRSRRSSAWPSASTLRARPPAWIRLRRFDSNDQI